MGSFSVLNNISSLNGQNKLNINNLSLYRTLQRLSSGKRINSGADDAAGLQIADSLRGNAYALNQAIRNASDGIGFCQIADGALSTITDMLHRMVTLAEEAVSEIIGTEGNRALDSEFQALHAEIVRIVTDTNYNGMNILDCHKKEYGETLDVFVGDLSAVSYIPIKIGCITTVGSISDAILNQIQASVTDPVVNPNGSFRFFATNNNGDMSQLLYGGSNPGTSWPAIRIDGEIYRLWDSPFITRQNTPIVNSSGVYEGSKTVYQLLNGSVSVDIVQKVSVVENNSIPGVSGIGGQSYKIEYEVINHGTSSIDFDLMYHVDTMLGSGPGADMAPFTIDGDEVRFNTTYDGAGIPEMIEIFDSLTNPFINGVIIPGNADRLNLGRYNQVNTFGSLPYGPVGDSGYSVLWINNTLAAGGTSDVMNTYYGVRNPPGVFDVTGDTPQITMFNMNPAAGLADIDLLTPENALRAFNHIREAVSEVSMMRGTIGAGMNRLQSAINVLGVTSMNTLAAESNIRDANIAEEITNLTKYQILAQSGMAALSHANTNAQNVLSLLQ